MTDGVEGLVVAPEDIQALAGALERLAANREMRLRMGAAARARFLHGYTEADVVQAYLASYRSMLKVG